ncbi:MAG: hypothetical protein HOV80_01945 [Polyangiaceae bacterium]|nr:hypothetical protein [Polyangiaceae bacterium]
MKTSLLVSIAVLSFACGGSSAAGPAADPEPAAVASAEPTSEPAPEATSAAAAASSAEAPAATPPATSGKPASTSKIGDKSLSSVDVAAVKAALEKAGYGVVGPDEVVTCGESETLQLSLTKKGKPVGLFSLQRPAAKPDSCKAAAVKEAYDQWKPAAEGPKAKTALTFDEPAGVLLALNLMKDDPGAAKKLMDALVTK